MSDNLIQSFESASGRGEGLTVHFAGWGGSENDWAWIELVFREPGKVEYRRRFTYATPAELGVLRDMKQLRQDGNGMADLMFRYAEKFHAD